MANVTIRTNSGNYQNENHSAAIRPFNQPEANKKMLTLLEKQETIETKFIVRPPTLDDLDATVDMFIACSEAMLGLNELSREEVKTEWTLPDVNLETNMRLVLTPDGRPVGYIEVWDTSDPPVRIWVWGRVHPDYEGQGIGTYLMNWAEKRARQAIKRAPEDAQVVMESGTYNGYEPAQELLADWGMEPLRYFWTMAIDLDQQPPEPNWPEGITIRQMRSEEELPTIVRAVRDSFRDHWGYVDTAFEQELAHWQHFTQSDENFDPSLWFLAMDGDEIAGLSLCWPKANEDPQMGWVSTLGVLRPWRRRGLGLALLQYSFARLYDRGQKRVGLGVDAGSLTGATRLYEKAGMRAIRQFDTFCKILRPGRDLSRQTL